MSRFTHAKFSALAAANLAPNTPRHATPVVKMEQRSMRQEIEDGDDEEYVSGPSANHKRKRVASSSASAASSSSSSSLSMSHAAPSTLTPQVVSFPLLSDEEPSLHTVLMQTSLAESSSSSSSSSSERVAPTSFSCVSKFLFSLSDESRDRGSAKLAVIHIALRHPCFASSSGLHFTTSFKIDGRKSFSNAPFKKFYRRAVHAAWFASSTSNTAATTPAPNAVEVTPTSGRVMLLISQRNGRPNGKGFTGLKHDTTSYSSKHPLLCLSSNSVEYYVSVFVNQSPESLEGETSAAAAAQPESWAEVAAEVSARFDAGEVTLEPVSLPSSVLGAPAVKRQRCVVTLPVSSASSSSSSAAAAAAMSSMRSVAMAESSSSPSSSPPMSRSSSTSVVAADADSMMQQYVEESTPRELASPVPSADSQFEQQSSADSPFTDPTEYESSAASAGTPLQDDQVDHVDMFGSSASPLTNSELEEPSTAAFHLADDELIGASSSAEHVWCPMAEQEEVSEDQLATPNLVRHSSTTSEAVFAFEQQQQQQSQQCSFPVNPFSEDHAHAHASSSSSAAPKPHRPRLVIHMDPLFEHGLLPLMSDMSWAATMASFPGRTSPLASPQPQPDHHHHHQSALPNLTF